MEPNANKITTEDKYIVIRYIYGAISLLDCECFGSRKIIYLCARIQKFEGMDDDPEILYIYICREYKEESPEKINAIFSVTFNMQLSVSL